MVRIFLEIRGALCLRILFCLTLFVSELYKNFKEEWEKIGVSGVSIRDLLIYISSFREHYAGWDILRI